MVNQYSEYTISWAALEFCEYKPNFCIYIPSWGQWYINLGTHWDKDNDYSVKKAITDFVENYILTRIDTELLTLGEDDTDKKKYLNKNRVIFSNGSYIIPAIETVLRDNLSKKSDIFMKDMHTLNLNNGVYDLREKVLRERLNTDYNLFKLSVNYDAEATCVVWEEVLKAIVPDENVRKYVQKFLGYCLTGYTREEIFHIWVGRGGNGKSTILRVVNEILSGYSKMIGQEILITNSQKSDVNKSEFEGRRLCISDENNRSAELNSDLLKEIVNGEGSRITARKLFKSPYDYPNTVKLIISGNHYPNLSSIDGGITRRMVIVPWTVDIKTECPQLWNREIIQELRKEYPGILNWLINGYNLWIEEGMELPLILVEQQEMVSSFNNPLCDFINDVVYYYGEENIVYNTDEVQKSFVKRTEAWSRYKEWCDELKINPAYKGNKLFYPDFYKYITSMKGCKGVTHIKRAEGWGYTNIMLTPTGCSKNNKLSTISNNYTNSAYVFVKEKLQSSPNDWIPKNLLFREYSKYCYNNKLSEMKKIDFKQQLDREFAITETYIVKDREREVVVKGISFKTQAVLA